MSNLKKQIESALDSLSKNNFEELINKSIIIAHKIESMELLIFLEKELTGYNGTEENFPEERIITTVENWGDLIQGDDVRNYVTYKNINIPKSALTGELEVFKKHFFKESISAIDQLIKMTKKNNNDYITMSWSQDAIAKITDKVVCYHNELGEPVPYEGNYIFSKVIMKMSLFELEKIKDRFKFKLVKILTSIQSELKNVDNEMLENSFVKKTVINIIGDINMSGDTFSGNGNNIVKDSSNFKQEINNINIDMSEKLKSFDEMIDNIKDQEGYEYIKESLDLVRKDIQNNELTSAKKTFDEIVIKAAPYVNILASLVTMGMPLFN